MHFFSKLVGGDEHKLRIGDFRLLAVLSNTEHVIIVERVKHRKNVYRR